MVIRFHPYPPAPPPPQPVVAEPGWSQPWHSGWGKVPILGQALGFLLVGAPSQLFPCTLPQELLLTPALLEQLTCTPGSRELGRILTVPQGQETALQGYRDAICRGQATVRAQRFSGLAAELRNQLDVAKIAQQVRPCLPAGPQICCLGWRRCQGSLASQGTPGPEAVLGCACGWVSCGPTNAVPCAPCPAPGLRPSLSPGP